MSNATDSATVKPVTYGGTIYCPYCHEATATAGGKAGVIYCKYCGKPFVVEVGPSETKGER